MEKARLMSVDEALTAESAISVGKAFRVYVDGVEQHNCIRAEHGMAEVYVTNVVTRRVYGEVRIEEIA